MKKNVTRLFALGIFVALAACGAPKGPRRDNFVGQRALINSALSGDPGVGAL